MNSPIVSKFDVNNKQTRLLLEEYFNYLRENKQKASYPSLKIWATKNHPELPHPDTEVDLWNVLRLVSMLSKYDIEITGSTIFTASFRKEVYESTGFDPLAIYEACKEEHSKVAFLGWFAEKYTIETILTFIEKATPWLSVLYLKYPLETFILKRTINSLVKKIREDINKKKKTKSSSEDSMDVISNIIYKNLFSKNEPKIRRASNKDVWANFTKEKLDYKSKQDFWNVEDGYIVRTFSKDAVIDESGTPND